MTNSSVHVDRKKAIRFIEKFITEFPFPFQSVFDENFFVRIEKDLSGINNFLIEESKSFNWISQHINPFEINKNQTLDLIKLVLENKIKESYEGLDALMENTELQETLNLDENFFFRLRRGEDIFKSKMDLFHISLKERRNCKSFRFSMLGFPTLYLGDSIELCVSEIFGYNMPQGSFRASCFKNQKEINLLILQSPHELYNKLHDTKMNPFKDLGRFLKNLPITVACLYKTPAPYNFPFNPEYIMPQMLMNHISKNNKLFGIKYPSTKFPYSKDQKPVYNYAFPMKKSNNNGYCEELLGLFDWTEPILSNHHADIETLEYILKEKAKEIKIGTELEKFRNGFREALKTKI